MSATEELRRLLDERDVKWSNVRRRDGIESDYLTEWQFEGNQSYAVATEWAVGSLNLEIHRHDLTAEQAVDVTLGRVECHDSNDRPNVWKCSECGATMLLVSDDCYEPTLIIDDIADVPHYCPNCGRKVTYKTSGNGDGKDDEWLRPR